MRGRRSRRTLRAVAIGAGLTLASAAMTTAAVTSAATAAAAWGSGAGYGGQGRPANAVLTWNANAGQAAIAACVAPVDNPLDESRAYAMMHLAVHDALNAIDRRYRPYVYEGRAPRGASPEAAVAAAAHDTLVSALLAIPAPFPPACGQAGAASVEASYTAALAAVPAGPAKTAGIAVGKAAAAAVLSARAADGSTTPRIDTAFPQGTAPGQWRFTPDRPFAFAPGWGQVTPFAVDDAAQFLPGPPPALTSRQYTRDFAEVKALGGDGTTTPSARTADQTQVALFWLESSPLMWNAIGRTVSADRRLDQWQSARLFGLLNAALADGYITSFTTKYHYRFWRPVTAIREAGSDGNGRTTPDPTWTPLVTTPPIPDYESAHSVEGAAAAAVLRGVLGTDRVSFSACSYTLPAGSTCTDGAPTLRRFTSFSQAADENGESRILIGFHFRTAVRKGLALGDSVGDFAVDRLLRPAH
jgi:PAP2 superfamily